MKPKLLLKLAAWLAVLTISVSANAVIWVGANLGSPGQSGSVVTNGDSTLTITAGGDDLWNGSDNGYYYYTWTTGNWDAKVNVRTLDTASSPWAKTEMMVRWSNPTGVQGNDAFIASMCAVGQNQNAGQYRPLRGSGAANAGTATTATTLPVNWIRMTRTNNIFTVYSSADGSTWTTLQTIDVTSSANGFGVAFPDLVSVGVAVTAHNDATTTTTTIDPPVISTSGVNWAPPSAAGHTLDVVNCNTYVGSEASFKFTATNNAAPVAFPMNYQWYKNGAVQPGLTRSAITWLAAAADAGTQVYCTASPAGYPSITTTSAIGTLAVSSSTVFITNALKAEVFAGASRADAYSGNTSSGDTGNDSQAGKIRWFSSFEDGGGYGDNTSRRYTGYFIPWASGNYTFYVAADDDTDVWLGSTADPVTKQLICQEPGWSGMNNWTTNADASTNNWDPIASAQKSSDTWTNGLGVAPNPGGIVLTAGIKYYLEVVEHNGGGGDNASLTAKLFADPSPTNGSASTLTTASNDLAVITWQPTTLSFTAPGAVFPTNTTVSEGQGVTFYARPITDSEFRPNYQWMRYGTNLPGVTGTSFSISPTLGTQNGMTVAVTATVPGLAPVTSATATLTIVTAVFEPGFVLEQKWNGPQNIDAAAAGTLGTPSYVAAIPALEASINNETGSSYTRHIAGFLIPATTGDYDFYTSSDDPSTIFLSTDADPANKREIARDNAWDAGFEWTVSSGTANLALKRSDQWTNNASANIPPYAAGIHLVANTRYYIEANHSEGGGGDHIETAMVPHGVTPVNGTDYAPKGTLIGINAPKANYVAFTLQPTNTLPIPAGPTSTANFYAFGITDSTIAVGDVRANGPGNSEVANQFVFFQWFRNGNPITGATASHYSLTGLRPTDNGAQYMCQMRALGYGQAPNTRFWSNSLTANLNVTTDATVPTLTYGGYYLGTEPFSPTNWVSITFSIPMDPNSLTNPANYTVSGVNVIGVQVSADGRRVQIAVDPAPTGTPTVTVTGARTWSNVALVANTVQAHALPAGLTFLDIGLDDAVTGELDPALPSRLYVDGPQAYTIAALGTDIWNTEDGFNFIYEQKSGDFDVVLRQTSYSLVNTWAKCGLMVREQIDDRHAGTPGASRNWNIVNDPPNLPVLSGGATGANAVECNWRTNNPSASGGWGNGTGMAPSYPNAWVRIKRVGQVLSAYGGNNGQTWTQLAQMDCTARTDTPPLPTTLYIGICTTGHQDANQVNSANPAFYNYASVDSYNSAYIAPPPAQTLTATLVGANINISWTPTGGVLQSSPDFVTWTDVGPANPASIPAAGAPKFFRVRTPFP